MRPKERDETRFNQLAAEQQELQQVRAGQSGTTDSAAPATRAARGSRAYGRDDYHMGHRAITTQSARTTRAAIAERRQSRRTMDRRAKGSGRPTSDTCWTQGIDPTR